MKYGRLLSMLLLIIVWVFFIYRLNVKTLFVSDDFRYHFIYEDFMPGDSVRRIQSLRDIAESMWNHYFLWGGRIPAHALAQLFLMWGKPVFNLINTMMYVLLCALIYFHVYPKKKLSLLLAILIPVMVYKFIPQFGMTMLWVSGACNYLYTMILVLLFLLPYRLYSESFFKVKYPKFMAVCLFVGGIIAGWTNENTAGAMIAMVFALNLSYLIRKKEIPFWSVAGWGGSVIGFLLLILAPGNFLRSNGVEAESFSLFIDVIHEFLSPLFILLGGSVLLYLMTAYRKLNQSLFTSFIYIFGSILATGIMFFSPERPSRTLFGVVIWLIIALLLVIQYLSEKNRYLSIAGYGFALILYALFIPHYVFNYQDMSRTSHHIQVYQYEIIEEAKKNNQLEVTIEALPHYPETQYNPYWRTANFTPNATSWFNSWAAKYFEVDAIYLK